MSSLAWGGKGRSQEKKNWSIEKIDLTRLDYYDFSFFVRLLLRDAKLFF